MQVSELVVKQVFVFCAGLVCGHDGELGGRVDFAFGQQLPYGQGLARDQLNKRHGFGGWRVAQRLQQASL